MMRNFAPEMYCLITNQSPGLETLDNLRGNSWYSVLDQGKAYHQGFVNPKSQPLTVFITHWGLYEWVQISFGLSPAPVAFQQFIENCQGDLRDSLCAISG